MEKLPHYRSIEELDAGLEAIRSSPSHRGTLALIVRRPDRNVREKVAEAQLTLEDGLVGDGWKHRGSSQTPDGSARLDTQITIMNVRAIAQISPDSERWPLAGDQLFVDLDLSTEHLPTGSRLAIGDALLEITAEPHNGCRKFAERFGLDALRWVNAPSTRHLNLRGLHATILRPGTIRVGDTITRLSPTQT